MAGEYLPPIVAELLGESDSAIRQIALVKVSLEDLADTPTTVVIDADITPFEAGLAQAEAEAAAAAAKPITFTTTVSPPSLADIAAARAAGGFATTTGGGGAAGGMFSGLAGVAAASALSGGGGGGGGGVLPAALAGAAAGGGGGGGGTSLLAALGFGGGMFGMAGLGSIASLAGFGFEHVLTTGLGLAGSAAGGLLGGGLLASGWAGTAAVGAGSDAAAMKDAAVEVQQYSSALDRLNRAIAIWGANSTQAKAAQYDLNQVTNTFTPALLQAVIATNNAKNATAQLWDTTAAGARATADTIFQQGLQLADTFIPLIGQAAQQNLGIISEGLKPLFAWLEGPAGIGIFEHLEAVFAKNLPTAVDAFDQAVMLVLRTVDVASNYTGHFIVTIDDFLRRMNSPAGFDRWTVEIGKLIGLFRDWEALVVIAVRDIADFFKLGAGLGTGIVLSLTQALTALNRWMTSVQGSNQLHALFAAHLREVLDALKLIFGVLPGLAAVYLQLAVPLTVVADAFIRFADFILNTPIVGQIVAYGVAIAFFANTMKLLTFAAWIGDLARFGAAFVTFAGEEGIGAALIAMGGFPALVTRVIGSIGTLIGRLAALALSWLGVSAAADKAAASETVAGAEGAGGSAAKAGGGLLGGGLLGGGGLLAGGGLVVVLAAIATALGLGGGAVGSAVGQGVGGKGSSAEGAGQIVGTQLFGGPLVGSILNIVEHWDDVRNALLKAADVVGGFFHDLPGNIANIAGSIWGGVVHFFESVGAFFASLPGRVAGFMGMVLGTIGQFFQRLPALIGQLAYQVGYFIGSVIGNVITFFMELPGRIAGFMEALPGRIASFFGDVVGWFVALPGRIVGFFEGIPNAGKNALATLGSWFVELPGRIWSAFLDVVNQMLGALGTIGHWIWQIPGMVWDGITGLANLVLGAIKDLAGALGNAIHGIISAAIGFIQGIISGIASHLPGGGGGPTNHAYGGTIAPGTWGIVNDGLGPEPIFAGPNGAVIVPYSPVTPMLATSGSAYSGGSSRPSVTINMTNSFVLSGLPQQIVDMVDAKLNENNQQLVAAFGA